MPNHVTNILRVSGDPAQVKSMFEAIQSDEIGLGSIDFNKVLPMPPSLDMDYGSRAERGMKLYRDFTAESTALAMANVVKPDADHENRVAALVKKYEALTKDDPQLLKLGEQCCNNIKTMVTPHGISGQLPIGEPNGIAMATISWQLRGSLMVSISSFKQHGAVRSLSSVRLPSSILSLPSSICGRTRTLDITQEKRVPKRRGNIQRYSPRWIKGGS